MRLGLFDRIRRLARSRRPAAGTAPAASGAQGKHRRGRGRGPDTSPASRAGSAAIPGGIDLTRDGAIPGGPRPASQAGPGGTRPISQSGPGGQAQDARPWPGGSEAPWRGGSEAPWASDGPPPAQVESAGPPPAAPVDPAGPPPAPGNPAGTHADRRMAGNRRGAGTPAVRSGAARARIREAPADAAANSTGGAAATGTGGMATAAADQRWHEASQAQPGQAQAAAARSAGLAAVAAGVPRQPTGESASQRAAAHAGVAFAAPHSRERPRAADGRRNCGSLEKILWRQWDPASPPPREVVAAVDRLAELPMKIKEKLAAGLDAIFVGPGGVPELDDMTSLRGVPLPAGRATWDACAGAYGERKIVVGSRPSPTPDVMCHEVGHALDDLDSPPGKWQSDTAEFRMLYDQCQPHFASDFHRQPGGLGRKEFFADAFSAIASRQRPALVDMLSGDTRTALQVMLFFNRRYGI